MTFCKRATELAVLLRGRGVQIDSQINWAALVQFVWREIELCNSDFLLLSPMAFLPVLVT